ncbi:hypothetical protein [Streptomyces sp. NRRL S-1868]|uniref:hypothetical protein n=1 Tax=Streptomyces sp. NRRL S-1868 TaxID=1463892 RepID=UPI0004C4F5B6|nr:hypothetical protein [Streptomyces sp. NRRL S-1868]
MTDPSPADRTDGAPRHPGLTIKIYTVNSKTLERGPATLFTLPPAKGPMDSSAFPVCECPRCRARAERAR